MTDQEWIKSILEYTTLRDLQGQHPEKAYERMRAYDRVLWIHESNIVDSHYRLIVGNLENPHIDDPQVLRDDGLVKLVSPEPVPYRGKHVVGKTVEIYSCIPVTINQEKQILLDEIWAKE